ncbi:MAG TPA: cupin domain-containing protein [Anaerolineaceae bacterium]|nr:cupin domain-containing protein [Anaerolineaceae bacterium]
MPRQFFTAEDVIKLVGSHGTNTLVLGVEDVLTAEAEEQAERLGLKIVRETVGSRPDLSPNDQVLPMPPHLPQLRVVRGSQVMLEAFGGQADAKAANVRLKDVITSAEGSPIAAGYMALDQGGFRWKLDYDEIDIVLEGELEILRGAETIRGGVGDILYIPKGSEIEFRTPSKVRFIYVTYPADWQ